MCSDTRVTRKGSSLAYGLVIMASVSILLSSILTFVVSQIKNSFYTDSKEQAFQIAESGIHFYKWYLAHNTDGRTTAQIQAFWDSGTALGVGSAYEADYEDPSSGDVIGRYSVTVTPPEQGSTMVIAQVTGWTTKYPAHTRTIQVRFRRPSWSENAVLANDFMRFGAGTEVYGRIHSNQGIRFDGVAHNLITSSVATADDPDHGGGNEFGVHTHDAPTDPLPPAAVPARADVFEAGREFPVTTTDFNGVLGDLSYMKSEAQAGHGRYFDNGGVGRHITLKTDDTYDICKVSSYDSGTNGIGNYEGAVSGATGGFSGTNGNACTTTSCCAYASCPWIRPAQHSRGKCVSLSNYPIVDNGAIFVEDNVWLSGSVNGKKVTIVAADLIGGAAPSVYIGNDIRYTTYDGSDIIGVIAQNDVEIIRDAESDLRIDAALLAQQGRVGMEHYGVTRSVITVYGAIATNQRYGFAWTDGTGYTTRNLYYDNNLLYYPPPYFPTGTQYAIDLWEEL
jgi:hypothetical protein